MQPEDNTLAADSNCRVRHSYYFPSVQDRVALGHPEPRSSGGRSSLTFLKRYLSASPISVAVPEDNARSRSPPHPSAYRVHLREPSLPSGTRMPRRPATRVAISRRPTVRRRSLHRAQASASPVEREAGNQHEVDDVRFHARAPIRPRLAYPPCPRP